MISQFICSPLENVVWMHRGYLKSTTSKGQSSSYGSIQIEEQHLAIYTFEEGRSNQW